MSDKSSTSLWSSIPKFAGDIKNKNKKSNKGNISSFKNFKNLIISALESAEMQDFIKEDFVLQFPPMRRPAVE